MSVQGIADNVLMDDLVPTLQSALQSAGVNGIRKQKLMQTAKTVTGFFLSDKQFNEVMWIAHYETGTNGLYYANGNVPDEFKKPKKVKPLPATKKNSDNGVEERGKKNDTYTDVSQVILKDGAKTVRYTNPKKVIIIPAALLISLGLLGAHLLGKI